MKSGNFTYPDTPAGQDRGSAKLRRRLAGDLDNIVLKALRKEPERRYVSAEQLAEDLRRHLLGLPVSATANSLSYRIRKFVKRHKTGVAATALVLIALLGGVIATLRQARIAAANEKRAEQRFNDVRALADYLLFDIHDSIADLPGATSARRVLIDRAVRYLDMLAHEAAGDPGLQRELAAAYQRLGDVQGQPRAASLGDSSGALQSYLRALQLRDGLVQTGGNSEDKLRLGEMHRVVAEMLHFSGDLSGAQEHARLAVSIESSVFNTGARDRSASAIELAKAYRSLGEVEWSGMAFGSLADPAAALDQYRKGLAIVSAEIEHWPGNAALERQREFMRIQIGRTLAQNGSRSEAIQDLRSSLAYFRSIGTSSNSARSQRDLATALEMLGFALERDGRFRESLSCFKEELAVLTRLFDADAGNLQTKFDWVGANFSVGTSLLRQGQPKDGLPFIRRAISAEQQLISIDSQRPEYRTWMAVFRVGEGEALMRLGRYQPALECFETARELYDSVARSDQLDMDEQLSVAATDAKIAQARLRFGDGDGARRAYQRAVNESGPLANGSDLKQQAQYTLADAYAGLGDISSRLAARADGRHRTDFLTDACSSYENSLRVWHAIPNPSLISPNGFDTAGPTRVEHQLVLCKRAGRIS